MVKNCQSFATNILLKKVIQFGNFGQKSLKLETLYENNFKSCSEKPQKKEREGKGKSKSKFILELKIL